MLEDEFVGHSRGLDGFQYIVGVENSWRQRCSASVTNEMDSVWSFFHARCVVSCIGLIETHMSTETSSQVSCEDVKQNNCHAWPKYVVSCAIK